MERSKNSGMTPRHGGFWASWMPCVTPRVKPIGSRMGLNLQENTADFHLFYDSSPPACNDAVLACMHTQVSVQEQKGSVEAACARGVGMCVGGWVVSDL